MASFLAFSAAFLAIISRFHLGISTPLGSWLGTQFCDAEVSEKLTRQVLKCKKFKLE